MLTSPLLALCAWSGGRHVMMMVQLVTFMEVDSSNMSLVVNLFRLAAKNGALGVSRACCSHVD